MKSKLVKSNKSRPALRHSPADAGRRRVGALLGALLLLAFIPSAGYAQTHTISYILDITTNWPPSTPFADQQYLLQRDARWGVDPYSVTNISEYTTPLLADGYTLVHFSTMTNYYVPSDQSFTLSANTLRTNLYVPYTNTLSVRIEGTNGMSAPVVWSFSAPPAELANSTAYKPSYTNNCDLTPIPTGQYTVSFPAVGGYNAPSGVFTNITWASPLASSITGTYTLATTSSVLTVKFMPIAAQTNTKWWVYDDIDLISYGPFIHNQSQSLKSSNDYTVSFGSVRGYYLAASTQLVAFTNNRILTNTFLPYSNNLAVTIAGVTTATNVIWTLVGSGEFTNSLNYATIFTNTFPGATPNTRTVSLVPTGNYEVTLPTLVGYTITSANPKSTNIVNTSPTVNNLTGTYARSTGNIQVNVSPSNGSWAFTLWPSDYTNYTSSALSGTNSATLTNAPVGAYTIQFMETVGFELPTPSIVTKTNSALLTTTFTGNYGTGYRLTVHVVTSAETNLNGLGTGSFSISPTNLGVFDGNESWYFSPATSPEITISAVPATNTGYVSYFYKWSGDIGEMSASQDPIVVTMDQNRQIYLYFSRAWNTNDPLGDIDGDGLPDVWERANDLNPESDKGNDGASGNEDDDFIPSASANPPWSVLVVTNLISYSGLDGDAAGYPLLRSRLLSRGQAPATGGALGYGSGVPFNNILECRGLDGYYLTNTPPGLVYASQYGDDPMTDPKNPDTDGDEMTDGWEYYFWYWRSANAYAAGVTNSANLDWVEISPSITRYNSSHDSGSETDGDNLLDITEFQGGTDPTHADTDADSMDDYWEINMITPSSASNALDSASALFNPDGDYMAVVTDTMLTNGTIGTAFTNGVCWYGGSTTNSRTAWIEVYTNTGANVFDLYRDTIIKASVTLTNHTVGTNYVYTNYFGTSAGLTYKNGYPVWVDMDNSGTYTTNDYAIVNPRIKHDGVYCMAPAIPGPGVCMFDPRTAWTNFLYDLSGVIHAAPNTEPYNNYQEYLGGDYIGRLSWDAGGQMTALNDPVNPPTDRNSYTLPNNQDTDGDRMPDGWELYTGLNPNGAGDASADLDGDILNNSEEWANATHPLNSCAATWLNKPWPTDPGTIIAPSPNDPHPQDTDWDGVLDGGVGYGGAGELGEHGLLSNPTKVDTDEDNLPDWWEVYAGTAITNFDTNMDADNDGLLNWQEYWTGTVPEWMLCEPGWGYFICRHYMNWNPPWTAAETNDPYRTAGSDLHPDGFPQGFNTSKRWFIPPNFKICPAYLYANRALDYINPDPAWQLAWLRSTNGFPSVGQKLPDGFPVPASERYGGGSTTYAGTNFQASRTEMGPVSAADSDGDGMDDFWEVFHCLNPIRGTVDLNFKWFRWVDSGPGMRTGRTDADPTTPGNQVGPYGSPFVRVMDLVNYYRIYILTGPFPRENDGAITGLAGPHNFGLVGMDPDNDGLVNLDEYQYFWGARSLHTCPSPLWRTSQYQGGPYSFVSRNYVPDNTGHHAWQTFMGGTPSVICMCRPHYPFRFANMTEGFDTDNDLVSDYEEVTGYRTNGIIAATDPLNDESPLRNRVVWLDGTNAWLRSYGCWPHYGDLTKFSVEAWVRPSRLTSTVDQVVCDKSAMHDFQNPDGSLSSSPLANFQLGISSKGVPYVLFHNVTGLNTNRALASQVGLLQVNKWAHLAGVFDGSSLTLYVNGEVSATHRTTDVPARGLDSAGGPPIDYVFWDNNCYMSIGGRDVTGTAVFPGRGTNLFAGCIDEVRVWDRVLSVGEIIARKDRRLTPAEVGTLLDGNNPMVEGANNLFAYYRFTDLPDPNVEGKVPSGYPTNRPALPVNYSLVYTNYLVMASDRVKRIPRRPPLDTRVIDGTPISSNGVPDAFGISTTNYSGIIFPDDFRNSANPYTFMNLGWNWDMGGGMFLIGLAQGLRTNSWLGTLDPNDPDSTDSDGDCLPDWWEIKYGLDPNDSTGDNGHWGDPDHDGLTNIAEYLAGTDPLNSDTFNNGVGDYDSPRGVYSRTYGEMYTDGDGMPDTWESENGLDPQKYDANLDLDGDGWSNYAEYQAGTSPNNKYDFPQPLVAGVANYYGNRTGMFRFYAYETNAMDGTPQITKVGTDSLVAEVVGQANGTMIFTGKLPIAPLDVDTVVRISSTLTNNVFVTFTFTGPEVYTYSGVGMDYAANLSYVNGRFVLRWASAEVPLAGVNVSVDYSYVNRNAAVFSLSGFKEGDFYMMALMDNNGSGAFDSGEPMGIMDDQPAYLSYSSILGIRVLLTDTRPGFGRFAWTGTTTTNTYPVIINKISESGAPTILQRSVKAPRTYFHEWDFQLAGIEGLMAGTYQWWMGSQNGTFPITWPASLATPSLVYPRGDVLYYALNQFAWSMDLNCPRAHFQVARGSADGTLVTDKYIRAPWMNEQSVSYGWLDEYASDWGNGVYYWRVAGWTPQAESAWSDWQTFHVDLSTTNSCWVTGDIYYFGKAPATKIIVEAFDNRGFGGRPVARLTLAPPSSTGWVKCSYTLLGLEHGAYYVRAFLDVTPAAVTGANGKLDAWESVGFYRDANNFYQAGLVDLNDVQFMDDARIIIRDRDTDNDKLPDAWEMAYFGNLDQTGDMDYDGDGETNLDEYIKDGVNQNPACWDSDGDGLADGFEARYNGAAYGFSSAKAVKTVLNQSTWDTDGDGYSDGAELLRYHTDPLDPTSYPRYLPFCMDAWPSPGDYDGDGRSDVGVYDFNAGSWSFVTMAGQSETLPFGFKGAQPMVGDYTGEGCSEFAFYDKGLWNIYTFSGQSATMRLGDASMLPVPADYTGDGRVDLAVFDTNSGTWYVYDVWSSAMFPVRFGASGMIPVPGDYNGDGAADLAVYESATGNWMLGCYHKYYRTWTEYGGTFGGPTWMPVPGDYDGDGRNDVCVFESNTGRWMLFTLAGQFAEGTFGWKGCVPVPGDYDGDGRTDVAIYDTNTGMWYILCMSGAYCEGRFGWPGASPITKGRF